MILLVYIKILAYIIYLKIRNPLVHPVKVDKRIWQKRKIF